MAHPDTSPAGDLTHAATRCADQLRAIPDLPDRIRATREATAALVQIQSLLGAVSHEAAVEMHRTMSYAQMAAELGVSRGRAQQLVDGPKPRAAKAG